MIGLHLVQLKHFQNQTFSVISLQYSMKLSRKIFKNLNLICINPSLEIKQKIDLPIMYQDPECKAGTIFWFVWSFMFLFWGF